MFSEESETLHVKLNEEEHMLHKKVDENNRHGVCEFERNFVDIEESNEGVIGVFVKNKLRIVDKKKDFIHNDNVEINEIVLD